MSNIDYDFIAENILGGDYTVEGLLDILNTTDDIELGRRLLPVVMNAARDDEATGEEANDIWTEWGAAWRSAANKWLAEKQLGAEDDISGMFPIIPSEEIGGLHADGYHFKVVFLSHSNWAARVNGQDQDYCWMLYDDIEELMMAYESELESYQANLQGERHERRIQALEESLE